MKPLRVLLFSNMYPSRSHPGYGVFVQSHVRQMRQEHGIDVTLVVSRWKWATRPGKAFKYCGLHVRAWACLFRAFDVVHVHYGSALNLLAAAPPLLLRRRPFIVTLHGGDVYARGGGKAGKRVVRFFLRRASAVIAVSRDIKERVALECALEARRISVIDVGCDTGQFTPGDPAGRDRARTRLGVPAPGLLLLFVGNLIETKGIDILLRALAGMRRDFPLSLAIVGAGPERERLGDLASQLGIEDRVLWAGEVAHAELPAWYRAADAFVLPSRSEGTPAVLLEAMASGAPVVAARVGGIPDLIEEGRSGLLFEPEDVAGLRRCLERLVSDASLRTALSPQAREVAEKHALSAQTERIMALYRSALRG